jgi:hypothetical protein
LSDVWEDAGRIDIDKGGIIALHLWGGGLRLREQMAKDWEAEGFVLHEMNFGITDQMQRMAFRYGH